MATELPYLLLQLIKLVSSEINFIYNGSKQANLSLNGAAYVRSNGAGLAFILLSSKEPVGCLPAQYMRLPNGAGNTAESTTQVLAVEFDIVPNAELYEINDNHVGIDFSSLISNVSQAAAYYLTDSNNNNSVNLKSGETIQSWIEYSSHERLMNVTISLLGIPRPSPPLISFPVDLSLVLDDFICVGFSASTGMLIAAHNVLGGSFAIGVKAQDLNPSELPSSPPRSEMVVHSRVFTAGITLASVSLALLVISSAVHILNRYKNEEFLEECEVEYEAHRFKYSDIFAATRGFGEMNLNGSGGFERVYRGVIPSTGLEVASGRLRHRNLVQLHGWCRRQDKFLLLYDYIPNGSLDKLLLDFDNYKKKKPISWEQRHKILVGVAQALLYLHEECDRMVVHRDVKLSTVLIEADLNPRLGDFGLARAYEHGVNPHTTHITGNASTSTDVYSYGVLMLEVAAGRSPIEPNRNTEELVFVDWVSELHIRGEITRAIDPKLEEYNPDGAKLVLSLGLICSHPSPSYRPSM
ncbi:Non-specific serine/threonine protein kinase [Bertholletia excelsa]